MLLDQLSFLFAAYWPYLAGAIAIGLVVGWLSVSAPGG